MNYTQLTSEQRYTINVLLRQKKQKSEIDFIIGKKEKDAILTLCERSTNYMIMQKLVHGKHADNLANTVIALLLSYKKLVKAIFNNSKAMLFQNLL